MRPEFEALGFPTFEANMSEQNQTTTAVTPAATAAPVVGGAFPYLGNGFGLFPWLGDIDAAPAAGNTVASAPSAATPSGGAPAAAASPVAPAATGEPVKRGPGRPRKSPPVVINVGAQPAKKFSKKEKGDK